MIDKPLFTSSNVRLTAVDSAKDADVESKWTHDLEYARSLRKDPLRPLSAFELKQHYDELLKKSNEHGNQFYFAIRSRQTDDLIGFVRILRVDWHNGVASLQLSFGDAEWLHDYGVEVLELALVYIFDELNLYRVSAVVPEFDESLLALLQQSGFTLEVRQRQAVYGQGEFRDRIYLGLLREEWRNQPGEVH